MEVMFQYKAMIHYLLGEKNTMADALSHLADLVLTTIASLVGVTQNKKITSHFELTDAILEDIKSGYESDLFTQKLIAVVAGMPNIHQESGFWFINNRLIVPNNNNIRETLFHLAHDTLGHFGAFKLYGARTDLYYWPKMQCDLEEGYTLSCADCVLPSR